MLGQKAIQNRLQKYFNEHYAEYDQDEIGWYGDEADNEWKFSLPNSDTTVVLQCDRSTGKVTEKTISTKKETDKHFERAVREAKEMLYR